MFQISNYEEKPSHGRTELSNCLWLVFQNADLTCQHGLSWVESNFIFENAIVSTTENASPRLRNWFDSRRKNKKRFFATRKKPKSRSRRIRRFRKVELCSFYLPACPQIETTGNHAASGAAQMPFLQIMTPTRKMWNKLSRTIQNYLAFFLYRCSTCPRSANQYSSKPTKGNGSFLINHTLKVQSNVERVNEAGISFPCVPDEDRE